MEGSNNVLSTKEVWL